MPCGWRPTWSTTTSSDSSAPPFPPEARFVRFFVALGATYHRQNGGDVVHKRTSGIRRYTPRPIRPRPGDPELPAETHVEQGPLDRNGVFELIRDRLADILEIDPSGIKEGDSCVDDPAADSAALIELVEALEEELGERTVGFHIDDEDLADLKTVRDAVDYVVGRLNPS